MQPNAFNHHWGAIHCSSFHHLDFVEYHDEEEKCKAQNSLHDYYSPSPSRLSILGSQLMNKANFKVSRVWYNLDTWQGYFGVYWYCLTMQQKFTLHCTLAKWDVYRWIHSNAWYSDDGPDLAALKKEFDDWVRPPNVSLKLLSWEVLNVHTNILSQCRDHRWRIILKLRHCSDQQMLYSLKQRFEAMYDLGQLNVKEFIHYWRGGKFMTQKIHLHLRNLIFSDFQNG